MEPESPSEKSSKVKKFGLVDLETWFNLILQRLFPVWYCIRYISELFMEPVEDLNPKSFLAHRWLSIQAVNKAAADSLEHAGDNWGDCSHLLRSIVNSRSHKRFLSVRNLNAVTSSTIDDDYSSLLEYAEEECRNKVDFSAEQFENLAEEAFPDQQEHSLVGYRECDGRYYLKNTEEPTALASLLIHCREKGRDLNIRAEIEIEYADQRAVEILRSRYWMLLMKRDSAYQLAYLIRAAKLPCQLAEFEWRRSDLVFLVLKKSHYRTAQIVEALIQKHFPRSVIEWGRYLSTHHIPFRNR